MNKLSQLLDKYLLKIGIAFLIIFTALYPKLPSVHIVRTWVYIRLEDFCILGVTILWFIQLLRRKVSIPFKISLPIFAYWAAGLLSLIFSLIFIGPHLQNFFPHVAALQYLRRIEYMILFFVAFSTVKSVKDVRDYLIILFLTITAVTIYGFGQHYYLDLWAKFPHFFEKYAFCFPSFQTGNEEFAKGIPLCLPTGARITSTFGGHYDLAAYLVLVLPVILAAIFSIKKVAKKILITILFICALMLLLFTASRISFAAYLIGSIATLIFYKRKWYIIPLIILSLGLLMTTSQSTMQRFLATVRISNIVTNSQGQLVGETTNTLPKELKNKISKSPDSIATENPPPVQNLPKGSGFIGLPEQTKPVATTEAVIQKTLNSDESRRLKLANGSLQISTVSGSFLIRKALVYDISFTTRFQAEWPNAWKAFLKNPLLGSGYSSITLATDNDYFRALGETGLLGTLTFLSIFLVFGIALRSITRDISSPLIKGVVFGLAGGMIGLLINATLIDVFEASKVAENLWILAGIGVAALFLNKKQTIPYKTMLKSVLTSNIFMSIYLLVIVLTGFTKSLSNFFVADDFTWLHWAASATTKDIPQYFINSQNFFYRPLDKTIVFYLYALFSFQPEGYHIIILLLHFLTAFAVYLLAKYIFKNKLAAIATALLFIFNPGHGEITYWFSTISVTLSSLFIMYAVLAFLYFRVNKSKAAYLLCFLISILAFLSYELAVVLPLLFIALDLFITNQKRTIKNLLAYLPFIFLIPAYFILRNLVHAFTGGGDYSYSLSHMIPNFIGNSIGYIGLYLGGEKFIPMYNMMRATSKQMSLIITGAIVLLGIIIIGYVYKNKKQLLTYLKNQTTKTITFGLAFAMIALLPYLALGNIAERYNYLASVGFSITAVIIIKQIATYMLKAKKQANLLFIAIILVILLLCQQQNIYENNEWQKAGEATKNVLATFRLDYLSLTTTDNLYFSNLPQKRENAWILPVGLPDGLWFIYRETTPHIYQVQTIDEAKQKIQTTGTTSNFIFTIDQNGKVTKVE